MSVGQERARNLCALLCLWLFVGAQGGCATSSGAGSQFVIKGDQYMAEGRLDEALEAYEQALEVGYSERKVLSKQNTAKKQLTSLKLNQAIELQASGAYQEALELLLELQKTTPDQPDVKAEIDSQVVAWVARAEQLRVEDDRAGAMRSLNRLENLYAGAPGAAETRSVLINEWTEVLLNRARDAEQRSEPAEALLNWAILAGLNPDEPYFAEELVPLRQGLMASLSVPVALYLGNGGMGEMEGDPEVEALRNTLGTLLADGGLTVRGVVWVERAYGELGPSVTVSPIGTYQSSDVQRGPGVYRVLQSTSEVQNPEYLRLQSRIRELEGQQQELSRKMDQLAAAHRHSEGPSRTKMEEALARAQENYDGLGSELFDLQQLLSSTPLKIEEPKYLEMPIEDEMHVRAVEVTLGLSVTTMDNSAPPIAAYVVGRGEEKDGLRIADPGRGIPEDPLLFSLTDEALASLALLDGLKQASQSIVTIPEEAAEKWLLHGERMETEGDLEAASRSYVNHVMLTSGEPGPQARKFLITEGLLSVSFLRGTLASP